VSKGRRRRSENQLRVTLGCYPSPQVIVKEPVQGLPHGGKITPAIGSEPPTPDQRINFGLAQLDPDAAQPFLTPVPVAAHPLGTGRARSRWMSFECRVGHDVPIADPHPEILPKKLHHWHAKRNFGSDSV
jgi:hypothetical protein